MSAVDQAPAPYVAPETGYAHHVAEALDLLYPGASADIGSRMTRPSAGAIIASFIAIPSARRARVLVPASDRRAAAAAARYDEFTSRSARWRHRRVVAALRTGADRLALRDRIAVRMPWEAPIDSIETYLAGALSGALRRDGPSIAIHIGPHDTPRTPVVQVFDASGTTIGFAKLGSGALPAELVRNETEALGKLTAAAREGALGALAVPRILHAGQWHGIDLLVHSPLPVPSRHATLSTRRLAAAMCQVATCTGVTTATLAGGWYWRRLKARIERVSVRGPDAGHVSGVEPLAWARALGLAADELVATSGGVRLRYGSWHGDWTPQHMAASASTLLVWDWERFAAGVPLGFDALHFHLHRLLDRGATPQAAVAATLTRAERLLAPFDLVAEAVRPTALLYLIDVAVRFLEDGQIASTDGLGYLARLLLPVVADIVRPPA